MSSPVISIENLSKKYLIGHNHSKATGYTALRDVIAQGAKNTVRKAVDMMMGRQIIQGDEVEEFWALRNLDLEIRRGDCVGLIGKNGAGKSTLLKILSRITEPTTGRVKIKGRVASLLEVGTGFHPELTGRENIFLNGAILGMSRLEIKSKFDEIVAFAEIEKFLDTPVKRYSSGMYVRLAFAIAAHLDTEILIVDEVLAVGDINFQKKCLGKMGELSGGGRTVIFVSHNMATLSNLCQKGIVLKNGISIYDGDMSGAVLSYYQDNKSSNVNTSTSSLQYETENVKLLSSELVLNANLDTITIHDSFSIRMNYRIKKTINAKLVPNFHVYRSDGVCAFVVSPEGVGYLEAGDYEADLIIPADLLNEGAYFVGVALTSFHDTGYADEYFDTNAVMFNVIDPMLPNSSRYGYGGSMPGVIRPKLSWKMERK